MSILECLLNMLMGIFFLNNQLHDLSFFESNNFFFQDLVWYQLQWYFDKNFKLHYKWGMHSLEVCLFLSSKLTIMF